METQDRTHGLRSLLSQAETLSGSMLTWTGDRRGGGRTDRSGISVSVHFFISAKVFSLKRTLFHAISSRIPGEAAHAYEKGILVPARLPTSRKAPRSQIDLKRQYLHPVQSRTHLKWITADEQSGAVFLTVYLHFKTGITQLFLLFGQSLRRSRKVCLTAETLKVSLHYFLIFAPGRKKKT